MYLSTWYTAAVLLLSAIWHITRLITRIVNRKALAQRHGCLPPPSLPQTDRLLGIDVLLDEYRNFRGNTYLAMLDRRFQTCGNTWSCRTTGRTNFATIDMENIKTVFVTNSQDYGLGRTRASTLTITLGHGIFTAQGEDWRFLRGMGRPGFAASYMRGHIEAHVQGLLEQIPEGGDVDLSPLLHDLTLHNAASILFGRDAVRQLDTQSDDGIKLAQRMNAAVVAAFEHTQDVMVLGSLAGLFQSSRSKEAIGLVYGFILENCRRSARKEPRTDDPSVATILYSRSTSADFDTIHIHIRHLFMAAEGTTAETLTHLFHLLSRHPRVLHALHAEITDVLPGQTLPTPSDLNKAMPYLNACIKEVFRLLPTVPFNNRVALVDTILPRGGGENGLSPILIPAGAEISLPHSPLYRRKDIFGDDADQFIPERWLHEPRTLIKQSESLLPFSIGKRACPGRQIALETIRYVAVRLVQCFPDIRDASGGRDWQENCGATLQSKFGAVVRMKKGETGRKSGLGGDNADGNADGNGVGDSGYSSEVAC
ncbi:cytochrome P450 [Aspergillus californicus]